MKDENKYIQKNSLREVTNFQNEKNVVINDEKKIYLILKDEILFHNKQKILDYISFAKIISSYGVIVLHLNHFWIFDKEKKNIWIIKNIYETIFYYSVPIFVLCIGATLLDFNERYGLLEYNKKRFVKVFIPLIGWTIILYLYKAYVLKNIPKISLNISEIWNYFFLSKIYVIFSSLHVFLLTYMLIPLLAYIEKSQKIRIYTYYFFLLLLTQVLIPYLINLFGNKIVWIYQLNVGYLIYIFAGYIIHYNTFSNLFKIIIYILGIVSFFTHLIGTKILTFRYNKIIRLHKGYLNLPGVFYSCSLFLFIKEYYYLITKIINKKYIIKIGSLTLGPFFMHLTLNETITKFPKLIKLINFNILFHSSVIFTVCIFISSIFKKIPLFKYLVP